METIHLGVWGSAEDRRAWGAQQGGGGRETGRHTFGDLEESAAALGLRIVEADE